MGETIDRFESCFPCAEPQAVLYCDYAGDKSSEDTPLGAFILDAVTILVAVDLEGEDAGSSC